VSACLRPSGMKNFSALVLACALVSGCNHLPGLLSDDSESRDVAALIAQANRFAGLQADDQKRDMNAASQAYAKDRSPVSRVRLALLLSLPGTAFTDEARALQLLDPLVAGGAARSMPLRQFAVLVHADLGERVREQRRSAALREQSAQMKEQLDALRAIERSIIERGKQK
jgi:hypothetical protein